MDARMEDGSRVFQPALPMRGVTRDAGHVPPALTFQPALPMRGVTQTHCVICSALSFQPALPMRGVTEYIGKQIRHYRFQPALPMRGVTWARPFRGHLSPISTRTPHAGSDEGLAAGRLDGRISTRTPHAGSDLDRVSCWCCRHKFQPALPMRGVTASAELFLTWDTISTRTPHAGSDVAMRRCVALLAISTRTPHAGSDH